MSVAKLNIEIGAKISNLQKGLRDAERELRRSGKNLASVANELTTTFSVALGGIGFGAIQAAGEMESLKLAMVSTFESAGRSSEEALSHIEDLRKAALAPGLDFEQANKASIRFQAVGLKAEDALGTIKELANAIAQTGGTAANLESVTVQMSQMISKGKVLSQDLRIIQENMPIISKLMKQAFGTSNADDLQKLGVSGKEFVDKITKEMAKLPRVQGGIANALVNVWASLKQAAADFGEEINRVFDITGKADQFGAFLTDAVKWFKDLDDSTKRLILTTALYVAAAGPVLKVLGTMKQTAALAVEGIASLIGTVKNAGGPILSLAKTIGSLRGAIALLGGGIALAAVTAIAGAMFLLSDNTSEAERASKALSDALAETSRQYISETAELNKNFDVLRNVNSTTGERKAAIEALQRAYPDYLKNIDLETTSNDRLTQVQKRLNDQILRGVAERQKAAAVTKIYERQADLLLQIQEIKDTGKVSPGQATLVDAGDLKRNGSLAAAVLEELELRAVEAGIEANQLAKKFDKAFSDIGESAGAARRFTPIAGLSDKTKELDDKTNDLTKSLDNNTKKVKEAETEYDGAARRVGLWTQSLLKLKEAQDLAGAIRLTQALKPLPQAQTDQGQFNPVESLTAGKDQAAALALALTNVQVGLEGTRDKWKELADQISITEGGPMAQMQVLLDGITQSTGFIGDAMAAAAGAIATAAASGASSLAEFTNAALDAAAATARMLIIEASLRAAKNAIATGGIFGALAAVAIGGLVAGGLTALVNSIKIPAHAEGTNYAPGGLSLVGERGPELVNLPRGSQVIPNHKLNRQQGSDVNVTGTFRVQGTDLLLVLERAQNRAKRTRGY